MPVYYKTTPGAGSFSTGAGEVVVQVECIGAGGSGGAASGLSVNEGAGGGGGGAYAIATSLSLTGTLNYVVGTAGASVNIAANANAGNAGNDGTDTTFNVTTCGAGGGKGGAAGIGSATGGAGGTVLNGTGYSGGRGGLNTVANAFPQSGGGGGGAAGPNGAGAQGVDCTGSHQGQDGGQGDNGHGGAAGTGNGNFPGGNGTEFDATHGSGGGGSGAGYTGSNLVAGNGGSYGAGSGGAAAYNETATSGTAGGGLIIITTTAGSSGSVASTTAVAGVGGAIDMGVGGIASTTAVAGAGSSITTVTGTGSITTNTTVLGAFAPVSQITGNTQVSGVGQSTAGGIGGITTGTQVQGAVAPTVFQLKIAEEETVTPRIFQEDTAGGLIFTVSGTFIANFVPNNIAVQCDVVGGGNVFPAINLINGTITGPASNGTYSGQTNRVPSGAFYEFTPSEPNTTFSGTKQSDKFGVGLLVAYYGQSNTNRFFGLDGGGANPDTYSYSFQPGSWTLYAEGTGAGEGALGWPHVLTGMRSFFTGIGQSTYPIGITGTWAGGTQIALFIPGTTQFTNLHNDITDPNFSLPRFIFFWQGESDYTPGFWDSNGYAADLLNIVSTLQSINTRPDYQFGIVIPGVASGNGTPTNGGANMVQGSLFAQSQQPGCFYIGCNINSPGQDHPDLTHIGCRALVALLYQMNHAPYGCLGPGLGRTYWPLGSTTMIANIVHGSGGSSLYTGDGGTSGGSLVGFTLSGTSKTIVSTSFVGNSIHFTMSAPRDGSDSAAALHHLEGFDPLNQAGNGYSNANNAKLVYDNNGSGQGGPLSTLLNDTVGFPLRSTNISGTQTPAGVPIGLNVGSETRYFNLHRGRR